MDEIKMSKCMGMDLSLAEETENCKNSAGIYFLNRFCLQHCQCPVLLSLNC